MAEPSAVAATAAGVTAVTVAVLGVEPQALLWAAVGCTIGLTFASAAGVLRATLTFLAVVLVCAAAGSWAAVEWFHGLPLARNSLAAGLGIVFHPLVATVVSKMPDIWQGILRRLGVIQ